VVRHFPYCGAHWDPEGQPASCLQDFEDAPSTQLSPLGTTTPQLPQLLESEVRSTQFPWQQPPRSPLGRLQALPKTEVAQAADG